MQVHTLALMCAKNKGGGCVISVLLISQEKVAGENLHFLGGGGTNRKIPNSHIDSCKLSHNQDLIVGKISLSLLS